MRARWTIACPAKRTTEQFHARSCQNRPPAAADRFAKAAHAGRCRLLSLGHTGQSILGGAGCRHAGWPAPRRERIDKRLFSAQQIKCSSPVPWIGKAPCGKLSDVINNGACPPYPPFCRTAPHPPGGLRRRPSVSPGLPNHQSIVLLRAVRFLQRNVPLFLPIFCRIRSPAAKACPQHPARESVFQHRRRGDFSTRSSSTARPPSGGSPCSPHRPIPVCRYPWDRAFHPSGR